MDLYALGEACNDLFAIENDRARSNDAFGKWLTSHRRDGMYDLKLYVRPHEAGFMSRGTVGTVNWIPAEDEAVYFGYPSEFGGPKNYRYEVPTDAYLPLKQLAD